MRQQFFESFDRMVGDAAEDVSEPGKWIDLNIPQRARIWNVVCTSHREA
jgi:hypothetical protein